MQFLDQAKIYVCSGDGGEGCVGFRRERCVEFGGPNGGDGGRGGDVVVCAKNFGTLIDYQYRKHFKADHGRRGKNKDRHGHNGENVTLFVPVGTQIFDERKEILLAELVYPKQEVVLLSGGNGGFGNARFKSSINQAPNHANPGQKGTEMWIWLILKLIADVGIVGLPNAGKSTFLSTISHAHPKIASYPFSTLHPNLGVVSIDYGASFSMADMPGLIEGAHDGKGLGHKFLQHIERCSTLLHVIDGSLSYQEISQAFFSIDNELRLYDKDILKKKTVFFLSKYDLVNDPEEREKKKNFLQKIVHKKASYRESLVFFLPAWDVSAIKGLISHIWSIVNTSAVQTYHFSCINYIKENTKEEKWQP